jgi:hypothetical protein
METMRNSWEVKELTFWRPFEEKEIFAKARDRKPEWPFLWAAIFSRPDETDLSDAIRGTTL